MSDINPKIEVYGEYINNRTKIKCRCLVDGFKWEATPTHLLEGKGCPVCGNRVVLNGINDISTTHPQIGNMIVHESDKLITYGSGKKIDFRCPDCGNIINSRVKDVVNQGLSCPRCSDGISYPNKFMFNLLSELNVKFIREYRPDWCTFLQDNERRYGIYDFYIPSNKIIIEMDGAFHDKLYKNSSYKTLENVQEIDKAKDLLALKNCIRVIRINCHYTNISDRKEHITSNILKQLSDIFDMSNIDFDRIDANSCKSNLIRAVKLWNENKSMTEISNILHINKNIITHYIKKADHLGLCEYKPYKFSGKKLCIT